MTDQTLLLPMTVRERIRHWLLALSLGVLIYFFSFGPALSLAQRGYVPSEIVAVIYRPIPLKVRVWYWTIWKRIDRRGHEKLLARAA